MSAKEMSIKKFKVLKDTCDKKRDHYLAPFFIVLLCSEVNFWIVFLHIESKFKILTHKLKQH